jgi:hypothetical protein
MAVNKGFTHKFSQEVSTVNPSIPDLKFSQGTVTLIQTRKKSNLRDQPGKNFN